MEEEARRIIETAVGGGEAEEYGWATRFSAQLSEVGFSEDEAEALELRGRPARPAELE
jgi:hypothetical protein